MAYDYNFWWKVAHLPLHVGSRSGYSNMSLYLKAGKIKNQLLTWDICKTNAINAVIEMVPKILELATEGQDW